MRILHAQAVALHAQDAVAGVAELEDIAGQAFHREILVHRADHGALRFQHHEIVGGVRDRAAGGERNQPRAAPRAQLAMHGVAVQVGGTHAAARGETFGQHAHDRVEIRARECAVGMRAAHQRVQRVLVPRAAGDLGDELLRQHVQRLRRLHQRVEFAAAHGVQQGGAFHQVVARAGEQPRLRRAADVVAGAARALQEGGDGTR